VLGCICWYNPLCYPVLLSFVMSVAGCCALDRRKKKGVSGQGLMLVVVGRGK